MSHSTYTTTQTGQDRVLKGDRQALSSSGRAGQARVLRGDRQALSSSGRAGQAGVLSPHWAPTSSSLVSPLTGTPVAACRTRRAETIC